MAYLLAYPNLLDCSCFQCLICIIYNAILAASILHLEPINNFKALSWLTFDKIVCSLQAAVVVNIFFGAIWPILLLVSLKFVASMAFTASCSIPCHLCSVFLLFQNVCKLIMWSEAVKFWSSVGEDVSNFARSSYYHYIFMNLS